MPSRLHQCGVWKDSVCSDLLNALSLPVALPLELISGAALFFPFQLKLAPESLRAHPVLPLVWALLPVHSRPWVQLLSLDCKLSPLFASEQAAIPCGCL